MNSLQCGKSFMAVDNAALHHHLRAAGAEQLTPQYAAELLRSSSSSSCSSMTPERAAAVLDFLFSDHPRPPPFIDGLPCLPGSEHQPIKYSHKPL
jgi:hypothetical protein